MSASPDKGEHIGVLVLVASLALLVLTATVASAAVGVNLRWTNCFGDAGVSQRAFACNSNTGSNVLAASLELASDLPQGAAVQVKIDLATSGASLPDWWKFFNAGNCRLTALSAAAQDGTNCPDWALGLASISIAGYNEGAVGGPNTAEINIANAVSLNQVQDLVAGQEYGVVRLTISNTKTVGTGSCAGCTDAACIIVQSVDVLSAVDNGALHILLDGPANGTDSNVVTWQSATECPAGNGTQNVTWGQIRALMR